MSLIDFILNVVGLLLWLNWRAIHLTPIARPGASLVATLKAATPPRSRWLYLGALGALLLVRGLIYSQIGPALPWHPRLPLGPATLIFRSDLLVRMVPMQMLLFSVFSFLATLAIFYLCLLVLSCLNANLPENDPYQRFIQLHLGFLERLPRAVKLLLPIPMAIGLWYFLNPLFLSLQMMPRNSGWHLVGQGALIGIAFYGHLIYLFIGIVVLYLVNSYFYLGDFLFWNFVNATGDNLLRFLRWRSFPLTIGKIDLVPPFALALLIEGSMLASWASSKGFGLTSLFQKFSS